MITLPTNATISIFIDETYNNSKIYTIFDLTVQLVYPSELSDFYYKR